MAVVDQDAVPGCGRARAGGGYATTSQPRAGWCRHRSNPRVSAAGRVRIVGGRLRGRRLPVLAVPGLRPTPDRVRETVFNWLQGRLIGTRCLDLFAGSGALGLEAASRGASQVVLVERNRRLAARLKTLVAEWALVGVSVRAEDARRFLCQAPQPFDLVFLDPPFGRDLLAPVGRLLVAGSWLAPHALLYVESEPTFDAAKLPPELRELRAGAAGEVRFRLLQRLE